VADRPALSGKELGGLALWHDANGNGVWDPGEVKPFAEYGILSLSYRYERDPKHSARIAFSKAGYRNHVSTHRSPP